MAFVLHLEPSPLVSQELNATIQSPCLKQKCGEKMIFQDFFQLQPNWKTDF